MLLSVHEISMSVYTSGIKMTDIELKLTKDVSPDVRYVVYRMCKFNGLWCTKCVRHVHQIRRNVFAVLLWLKNTTQAPVLQVSTWETVLY